MLSIAAIGLAGTAAWFSIFGLTQLFYGAGIGITILAASLEFAKVVTVSYVYRFWKLIEKALRGFYIFAVVFIMFLTSMGIYGFLISGYQKSANKIQLRDAQVKIAENKRTLFINQLDRVNKSIQSSSDRINTLSNLRNQQEKRIDNLYNQKYISAAKDATKTITVSDEQIKILNQDITDKMKQTNTVNDSISFYDQKIAELKASDVSNEISSYQFIADLTGIAMNRVVNLVALVIIFVFDPLAIALLIAVNRLTMNKEDIPDDKLVSKVKGFFRRKKEEENENENEITKETKIEETKIEETPILEEQSLEEELSPPVEEEKTIEQISTVEPQIYKIENSISKKNEIFSEDSEENDDEKVNLKNDKLNGLKVYHDFFGNGVIEKFSKDKNSVFVKFDKDGLKELSSRYANLKRRKEDIEAVKYLDFAIDDPEIKDIIVKPEENKKNEISLEDVEFEEKEIQVSEKKIAPSYVFDPYRLNGK